MHPTAKNKSKGLGHFFVIFIFFLRGPAKVTFNYFSLVLLYASSTGYKNTDKNQEVRPRLVFLHAVLSCFFSCLTTEQSTVRASIFVIYGILCAIANSIFFSNVLQLQQFANQQESQFFKSTIIDIHKRLTGTCVGTYFNLYVHVKTDIVILEIKVNQFVDSKF